MFEKLKNLLGLSKQKSEDKASSEARSVLLNLVFVVFVSYFASSMVVSFIIKKVVPQGEGAQISDSFSSFDDPDRMNYRNFQKAVIERNLFNDTGAVPPEEDAGKEEAELATGGFNLEGPCPPTSLKLKLLGTISLSNKKSYAAVREEGVASSDIYQVGDQVFGEENVKVVEVRQNVLIMNNGGRKECLYATKKDEEIGTKGSGLAHQKEKVLEESKEEEGVPDVRDETVRFKSSWVRAQLGPGFTKIMQDVTTPPNVSETGAIRGFKFFGVGSGSLLGKMGIKDGDVVLSVNGNSTNESIFVLYQALNDEVEVIVRYERGDKEHSVKVMID